MIITRIGFCPECYKTRSPKTDQKFLVFGNHTNQFHVRFANCTPPYWGFTPHIYEIHKNLGENVVVLKSCAMDGCGVTFKWDIDQWLFVIKKHQREVWTLEKWQSLVELKHNTFTKIYEI